MSVTDVNEVEVINAISRLNNKVRAILICIIVHSGKGVIKRQTLA
jgi:hypothetical protein